MKTAQAIDPPLIFTTYDIGRMTGTDPTTVHKWIDKGLLRGYRTPGGHRRVRAEDLRQFLLSHRMPVPRELGGADSLRVMLVDDEAGSLKSACKALRKLKPSWDVVTASSGVEALLMVTSSAPDVLVFDAAQQEVDGVAVCKHLQSHSETSRIRLVALTSKPGGDQDKKMMSAGAAVCLRKPATGPDLANAIEVAVGLRAPEE